MEPSNTAGRGHSALQGSQNSIIREPISIFQEIEKEADPLKKRNLQELLNKLRNLYPSELKVGASVAKGDDFFDSIAQRLNELKNEGSVNYEGIFTVKSLRKDCADYASQNREHAKFFATLIDRKNAVLDDYFVSQKDTSGKVMTVDRSIGDIQYDECVINEQATYQKYINDIQYTAEEIGNTERHSPIWGKPELEGKMICYKYGIKLEVIESRSNGLGELIRNEYGIGEKRITIVKYNEHFVPLLSSISQDVTRDQEVLKSVVFGTPLNRQLLTKRKGGRQDGEPSVAKKPKYDDQNVIGSELKESKKFIEDLFDKQPDNAQKIIEQLYGYDPVKRVINPFQTNLENHFVRYKNPYGFFSMFYKKLSNPNNLPSLQDFATELAKLWIKSLSNNAIELQPVEISGTYNSLSKLSTYVLKGPSSATFKSLITGLANRAKGKDFNAQEIANIYNALSKWVTNNNINLFKPLIKELATQAKDKDFNAQEIANIYNALSKWVNNDNVGEFKTLITQLAIQAKDKDFNTLHIANIYNALSKWVTNNNINLFKPLITQLAGQAKDKDFNTQEIAMIYNALSKWVTNNNINLFKPLITQLAGQAKDKKFDAQAIANIYNALSKWVTNNNINLFEPLITELTRQAVIIREFNAQAIANIYNALSKYPKSFIERETIIFRDLVKDLAEKIINAKQFEKRGSASIIRDLPKLVEANLIADNCPLKDLLISLMKSFSYRRYQNKFVDSSRYFSEENLWTAVSIKNLAESIQKLNLSDDDKRELKSAFDDNISKILNRLSRFRLNSYRLVSILEGVTKLISLGVVSNNSGITQPLNKLFENFKKYNNENKLTQEILEFFRAIPDQAVPARHIETDDLRLTPKNILAEGAAELKRYNLPEDLERFIEEVLKPQGIEYISTPEARNLKGVFIAEVRALGRNQWGIYAREKIKAGSFLGIYDGERMSSEEAEKNRKNSAYLFDLNELITIDASQLRNWAAYVNYAIIGTANIRTIEYKIQEISLAAQETISPGQQLLLDYGNNYFTNVDYSPIYLHPTDNWKTPKGHYDEDKVVYSDKVILLPSEMAKAFGLKQEYIAATKLFQEVYTDHDLSALLSSLSVKAIDLPSYSLELMSDKKWKFSEYDSQQNITPLMLACYLGKEAEVELLLKHGADPVRRTLHGGHNALFLAVLSNAESGIKENIFNKLINYTLKALKNKSDTFYASGYEKPSNYNKLLPKDLSKFLQLTDSSGSNIFDHMIDKGKYNLWKKYFDYKIGGDEVNNKEEKRKIAEKFISDKGILSLMANINGDGEYKEVVEILLGSTTQKFINQRLQDLESEEIDSLKTEEIDRILENLRNLDYANKKGKIVSIVTTLLLNETNKLKDQLALGDQVADITTKVQEIRNRFTNVLEHLGSKNKLDTEIRAIERFKTSGCGPSGVGRGKREAMSCRLNANEYIERLRELLIEEQIRVTEANEIDFIGSAREVGQAEKARDLLRSETMTVAQKSYEMDELFKNPRKERILDLSEDISQFADTKSSKTKQGLMNAAGRIQFIRGVHETVVSCIKQEGSATISTKDCAFNAGEMGFSFLSQSVEKGMLKITPKVVKSAASVAGKVPGTLGKNLKFAIQKVGAGGVAKKIAKGVAGVITSVFDIADVAESANNLINCLREEEGEEPCSEKEKRDSIAGITFSSVSLFSAVAFTVLAMPGAGTVVGLALMVGQEIYSGVSNIKAYEDKYDITHDENWRIFWHTVAFQPIPQDVQRLAADTEVFKRLAEEAWKHLENSTDVVATAMGLGDVTFSTELVGRMITETSGTIVRHVKIEDGKGCTGSDRQGNLYSHKSCSDITVKVPHILPSYANIKMNKKNADTKKLARTASIISGSIPANAQMLGLPQWSGKEYEYQEGLRPECLPSESDRAVFILPECITKVPYYSENPEAIYPFYNAFVIANSARMANHNKNQTILFDLRYVNSGTVVGNNERKNAFLIHGGHAKIFGGNGTQNIFHLLNKDFSGRIYGGNNASNVLDLSNLNGPSILYEEEDGVASLLYKEAPGEFVKKVFSATKINGVIGSKDRQEYIDCKNNEEVFINSEGGYESDEKDFLMNCKKAVIWPYTKATGGDGNYVFYIKPNNILETVGRSEIDVSGNGTLIFPETALLNDCDKITYSSNNNTLFFEIPLNQGKTFVLGVKNYLNQDKTPKFHLIDKHGSNIVPIIKESDLEQNFVEIKSFRLNAEKEAFGDIEEDEAWYRSISQSHEDYQVFGVIKDKRSKQRRIFGNPEINILDMSEDVVFAQGRNGSDVYLVDGNSGANTVIDNYSEDRELDVLLIQQHSVVAHKIGDDLRLYGLPYKGELIHKEMNVKNYFQNASYQHLMISTNEGMLIPFNLEGKVHLVPFYHASNGENAFLLPENSKEVVIDAKVEDTEFYRNKGDLLLIRDKDEIPLTIIVKDFYFDQSKWQSVKPYFWNRGEFSSFNLSQKAAEALSYEDKIKSDYEKIFKDYVYTGFSEEIAHNQQRLENGTLAEVTESEKRIGILIFRDIDPSRIGLAYSNNNLIFFDKKVDHNNLIIQGWNDSKDHRISRVEFDLESGRVVINKLDRFDLSAEGIERMKDLFYRAKTNEMIDRSLKAKSEIANNFQCLITMYGLYKGSNTYKCLGFLVLEDQINFAKAYCNSQKLNEFTDKVQKNNLFARSLILFIIKLHNNLLLNGYSREETARCPNIILYKQFFRSTNPTKEMQSIRNITNTMNSEIQAQLSTTTVSPKHRHHHEHRNATAQQRNRRAADENREKESIPSSASRPKPWIKTAFDFATKGIAKLGALIFSSSNASLPIEHPTLSSQQGSTRNSNVTTIAPQINVDGTILLLDVFIRKITGENYVSLVNQDVSLLGIQADALNITKELGKILSTTFNTPAEELIDLPEVQSKIFKAMMSGRGNEILGILCSYVEKAKLESEVTEKILSAFQPTKPTASKLGGQIEHLPSLPNASYHNEPKSCLSDIKMTDYSNNLAYR